jgi:hypothetical protein
MFVNEQAFEISLGKYRVGNDAALGVVGPSVSSPSWPVARGVAETIRPRKVDVNPLA